jgi:hypothetical protein
MTHGYKSSEWGPWFWRVWTYYIRHLPRHEALVLLRSLSTVLPCCHCRESTQWYQAYFPPERATCLLTWFQHLYNFVNLKLGKPVGTLPLAVSQSDIIHVILLLCHSLEHNARALQQLHTYRRCMRLLVGFSPYTKVLPNKLFACTGMDSSHIWFNEFYQNSMCLQLWRSRTEAWTCFQLLRVSNTETSL